jgi:acetyltransferase-like isoleucine patch superfamily enzyme
VNASPTALRATLKTALKASARAAAFVAVLPAIVSFRAKTVWLGPDRAVMGSTQLMSLIPGIVGQYMRTAFLRAALDECAPSVVVEFGTIFSKAGARLGENVYIGPMCHIGLAHIERDVLIAAAVHIPSGPATHGTSALDVPIREQPGTTRIIRIGAGCWVGSAAVVLADVGPDSVIAAGAVVTKAIPSAVVAAGVPAAIVRTRS